MTIRVLLAEDEELLREILCEGLSAEGFDVVAARNGEEALRLFQSDGPFQVLLLDHEMPRVTGMQVIWRLREDGEQVPVVVFSGNLQLDPAEQARLRIHSVLRKPFPLTELTTALRDALVP